jgi:hypothetical protein
MNAQVVPFMCKRLYLNNFITLEVSVQQHFTSNQLLAKFSDLAGSYRYNKSHFCKLLRHKLGMYCYKPSPRDCRCNAEAETQLKERLRATLDALTLMGKDISKMGACMACKRSPVRLRYSLLSLRF